MSGIEGKHQRPAKKTFKTKAQIKKIQKRQFVNESQCMSNSEMRKNFSLLLPLLLLMPHVQPQQTEAIPEVELDVLSCPISCACQYATLKELQIAHWVLQATSKDYTEESYDSIFGHSYIKLATCLLQAQSEAQTLIETLPIDLQALSLIYTGVPNELTVNTSSLKPLNQLTTLEIHGAIRLVIDEPLEFLQHASFEKLTLLSSEKLQRPKYSELPSDNYKYKPRSEILLQADEIKSAQDGGNNNMAAPKYQLEFEAATEQVELNIMPYEQYVQTMKQTRMPSFYGWSRLEVLRVHDCQLSELHWQMFDGLAALRHLSLEQNGIETLPPFALFGALHIKTLSLAHNKLHRLQYLALAGLLELETLNLNNNRLERLSEHSFPPLPKLLHADFRQNPVRYIFPATFWVMNDTQEMQFGSTETALEIWTNQPFDSLYKLRTLRLENVSTSSLEQGVFKGLHALETLTIRGELHSVEFDAFAGLGQLRELDMSYCGIRDISMDALMGCKQLKILNLAHNNLISLPPGLLDDQQQLSDIQLQGNQLHTLPTTFFLQPRLQVVHLNNNPWQCSCDMSNWMPRLTNVVRGPASERCITDFLTGKKIACRLVDSFETDKSLTPRCANYNGRSVYYVMRKQLHCGGGPRVLHNMRKKSANTHGLPHWRKVEQMQLPNQLPKKPRYQEPIKSSGQHNSLDFVLKQQHEKAAWVNELQTSNEI